MSTAPKQVAREVATIAKSADSLLRSRESQELIIGLAGPLGAGLDYVLDELKQSLIARDYVVHVVKISTLFREEGDRRGTDYERATEASPEFRRVWDLQTLGNQLRAECGEDIGAQLAIRGIATHRATAHPGLPIGEIVPKRVAYIVDQLKNPREVQLLRTVYRNLFYMVGVLTGYHTRKNNLQMKGIESALAERAMSRDRRESEDNGQQLDKTLHHAEFFVSNSNRNLAELRAQLDRFVGLIHGDNGITPTHHERGMFAAHTASLRSACLSRQVGAAILDKAGNILSTGCNDVPRAGGGLYEPGTGDMRCVVKDRFCHNDRKKRDLLNDIKQILSEANIAEDVIEAIAGRMRKDTRIKDLIEFSRAVHAEMDAIVTIARTGSAKVEAATMYTTTYPCHSCARHIVAAGISAVYFIEPYEKSLAIELHNDAISADPLGASTAPHDSSPRVAFMHFEGVSPHKFTKLFHSPGSRKDSNGHALPQITNGSKKIPEFLDDYIELESRVIKLMLHDDAPKSPSSTGGAPAAA